MCRCACSVLQTNHPDIAFGLDFLNRFISMPCSRRCIWALRSLCYNTIVLSSHIKLQYMIYNIFACRQCHRNSCNTSRKVACRSICKNRRFRAPGLDLSRASDRRSVAMSRCRRTRQSPPSVGPRLPCGLVAVAERTACTIYLQVQ